MHALLIWQPLQAVELAQNALWLEPRTDTGARPRQFSLPRGNTTTSSKEGTFVVLTYAGGSGSESQTLDRLRRRATPTTRAVQKKPPMIEKIKTVDTIANVLLFGRDCSERK